MLYRDFSGVIIPIDEPEPLNLYAERALVWFADAIQPGTVVSVSAFANACRDMGASLTCEGRALLRGLERPYEVVA